MENSAATVRAYYDSDPEREWERLDRHRFELPVTMHFLRRLLPAKGRILDVGGGPGRYAIELASQGYAVDLFDLSPRSLEAARRRAAERNTRLEGFHEGDAVDLGRFADGVFDAVLLFGPLYHLLDESQRTRAVTEALRVLRVGGLLAAAFLSSYAGAYDMLSKDPGLIRDGDQQLLRCRASDTFLASRDWVFTDAFYIEPFEIEPFMARFPLHQEAIIGAEGLTAQSQARIGELGEGVIRKWIDFSVKIADTKGAIASSIHVMYFGRKA
jgi:S-adenosylmethionine-dependent methyltransferase